MARYTGPKARVSRRLGTNIWGTKGENIAMEKRPYPPGEHGRTRRRGNVSEYLLQLQEKQKARFTYGINERQFRNLYDEASRRAGRHRREPAHATASCGSTTSSTAPAGRATRPQARQFVGHGHVEVNGRRVDIPSYRVRKGDVVQLRDKAQSMVVVQWNMDMLGSLRPGVARDRRRRQRGHRPRAADPRADRHARARAAHRRAVLQVVHHPSPEPPNPR